MELPKLPKDIEQRWEICLHSLILIYSMWGTKKMPQRTKLKARGSFNLLIPPHPEVSRLQIYNCLGWCLRRCQHNLKNATSRFTILCMDEIFSKVNENAVSPIRTRFCMGNTYLLKNMWWCSSSAMYLELMIYWFNTWRVITGLEPKQERSAERYLWETTGRILKQW